MHFHPHSYKQFTLANTHTSQSNKKILTTTTLTFVYFFVCSWTISCWRYYLQTSVCVCVCVYVCVCVIPATSDASDSFCRSSHRNKRNRTMLQVFQTRSIWTQQESLTVFVGVKVIREIRKHCNMEHVVQQIWNSLFGERGHSLVSIWIIKASTLLQTFEMLNKPLFICSV